MELHVTAKAVGVNSQKCGDGKNLLCDRLATIEGGSDEEWIRCFLGDCSGTLSYGLLYRSACLRFRTDRARLLPG
jgi:hypothetical protein